MNKRKPGAATRATRRGRGSRSAPAGDSGHNAGDGLFALAAECTIADASALKGHLAKLLDESGIVTIDVSAVQRIDTAGLQIIIAFVRERESQGRQVQWRGHAPALANAAGLLGLSALLRLPAAQAVETEQ